MLVSQSVENPVKLENLQDFTVTWLKDLGLILRHFGLGYAYPSILKPFACPQPAILVCTWFSEIVFRASYNAVVQVYSI